MQGDRLGELLYRLQSANVSTHTQHSVIRLRRLINSLESNDRTAPVEQLETLTRIKSRVEEIAESLRELAANQEGTRFTDVRSVKDKAPSLLGLANLASSIAQELDTSLKDVSAHPRVPTTPLRASNFTEKDTELARKAARGADVPHPPLRRSASSTSAINSYLASTTLAPETPSTSADKTDDAARALSRARFLHLLAEKPDSVLSAGMSLGSVFRQQLTRAPAPDDQPSPAVPASASQSLGPASSSVERCHAWSSLRSLVWENVGPLIPSKLGTAKLDIEAALCREEPFHIDSARGTLQKVVRLQGKLCAPSRDAQVQAIEQLLARVGAEAGSGEENQLKLLLDVIGAILALSSGMRDDLTRYKSNSAAAAITDEGWQTLVKMEAEDAERMVVKQFSGGMEAVKRRTVAWATENTAAVVDSTTDLRLSIAHTLLVALFKNTAVSFHINSNDDAVSTTSESTRLGRNQLPPIFAVPLPRLLALQNDLQAIVILACLCTLVRLPSSSSRPGQVDDEAGRLVSRLWTLLSTTAQNHDDPETWTKLDNISDEIIDAARRARSDGSGLPDGEAQRITDGVKRILRYEDPVHKLLKQRLASALTETVRQVVEDEPGSAATQTPRSPSVQLPQMRSGRGQNHPTATKGAPPSPKANPTIKGFEGLSAYVQEAETELISILRWTLGTWHEVLGV